MKSVLLECRAIAGEVWRDPPNYHPNVVWPAYVYGHKQMFHDGNVETGDLLTDVSLWEGRKDQDQIRGGWAEAAVARLHEAFGPPDIHKGKGKKTTVAAAEEVPQEIVEFRPQEGSEGMEDMVNRSLARIFDAARLVV